jgi:hypothetical protein
MSVVMSNHPTHSQRLLDGGPGLTRLRGDLGANRLDIAYENSVSNSCSPARRNPRLAWLNES